MRRLLVLATIAAATGSILAVAADATPASVPHEPKIEVRINGDTIRVDVDFQIDAPRAVVWSVLTDYENMPRFISNLTESKVLERTPERARLRQKGVASFGPITFPFDSEREVVLAPPDRIQSRQVRGNLKRYQGSTVLHAQGKSTRLELHSEAATDAFIPPYFGRRFIENETREQYLEIAAEVARRRIVPAAVAPLASPPAPDAALAPAPPGAAPVAPSSSPSDALPPPAQPAPPAPAPQQ